MYPKLVPTAQPAEKAPMVPSTATPASSVIEAAFADSAGRTRLARVFERGAMRLRVPRGTACEAILVNTGGGIVGGDEIAIELSLGPHAAVAATSIAAEKIYRSHGAAARLTTRLTLASGARLDWLPQETILFDGCNLHRDLHVDMAGDARLVAAETIVFGRLASRETAIRGALRDRWRVRRDGRLVFADDSRLEGAIGAILDRPAVAAGARAVALMLVVAAEVEALVDPLRAAVAPFAGHGVEAGVSARDGLLTMRLLARAPERLRGALTAALVTARGTPLPRAWR